LKNDFELSTSEKILNFAIENIVSHPLAAVSVGNFEIVKLIFFIKEICW